MQLELPIAAECHALGKLPRLSCCGGAARRPIVVGLRCQDLLRPTSRAYALRNQEEYREETMRHPLLAAIGVAFVLAFPHATQAQGPAAALTGLVSSAEEPAMEGVLVSATRTGSNITITVVTGADGRYRFPADRLAPGQYSLAVRAVGYELEQPRKVEIAAESTGSTAATA